MRNLDAFDIPKTTPLVNMALQEPVVDPTPAPVQVETVPTQAVQPDTSNVQVAEQPTPAPQEGIQVAQNIQPIQSTQPIVEATPVAPEYDPKTEIAKSLKENKELFLSLGIDGNRFDQFAAEMIPQAASAQPEALAMIGTPKFYRQIAGKLILNESGGNYGAVEKGSAQAFGKYQFTPARLRDLGYTGTMKEFLSSPKVQEEFFSKHMGSNYNWLTEQGMVNAQSTPQEVAGYLYAMHLGGYGGARAIFNGGNGSSDSNGTSVRKYYNDGFKYADKLVNKGANNVDDVVTQGALKWAVDGKNELADRDQAVAKQNNPWLASIRQHGGDVVEAVDKLAVQRPAQETNDGFWSSNKTVDHLNTMGVGVDKDLTFWDRFTGSRKESYGQTTGGLTSMELDARAAAEDKLQKALGIPVALGGRNLPEVGQALVGGTTTDGYEDRFNQFIQAQKASNPGAALPYNSYKDVLMESGRAQLAEEQKYVDYTKPNYSGFAGGLAGFTGGVVGTLQDPTEAAKMVVGGAIGGGAGLAAKAGISAAVNAGIEVPTQIGVYEQRQRMGLPATVEQGVANVALVGAMGAAAPVVGHALSKGVGAIKGRFNPASVTPAETVAATPDVRTQDLDHLEAISPLPPGPENEIKLDSMINKAAQDVQSGNPVTIVTDDVPIVKGNIRQELAPQGEDINFDVDTTFKSQDAQVAKEFQEAMDQIDNIGTASKEEYQQAVDQLTPEQVRQAQQKQEVTNYDKKVKEEDDLQFQQLKGALETTQSIQNTDRLALRETLEQIDDLKNADLDLFDMAGNATDKAAMAQAQLDSLSGDFSTLRNQQAVLEKTTRKLGPQLNQQQLDQMAKLRGEFLEREKSLNDTLNLNLDEARTNFDTVHGELESLNLRQANGEELSDQLLNRQAFLEDARVEHESVINSLEKNVKASDKSLAFHEQRLNKITDTQQKMLDVQAKQAEQLDSLLKSKGEEAVRAEIAKREEKLNKIMSDYNTSIEQNKIAGDTAIDILDENGLPTKTTVKELLQNAQEEADFLKIATSCLTGIGI